MPTIQEIIAKRKELGPTATTVDAKNAITPVSPTTNANVAQLEANRARVQSQIASGERPAVGTSVTSQAEQTQAPTPTTPPPAPVTSSTTPSGATISADGTVTPANPVAPVTPTTPTVTTTPAPVTQKVEPVKTPVVDYTQAQGREQDIIKNLETFKAQNMTPEQIMRASDYQNATPEKKALIDPYLKQQVPTASAMYNAIATKADIPDDQKTTLPFKIAQNRYTKANSFATMTPSQLANEMNNSRFIQGSQAYEDVKAMNPKLVQDTENLRIVNGSKQNVFTYINNPDGTSTKVNNLEKTFADDYMDNFGDTIKKMFAVQTPDQIRALIYTDDVKQAQDKASEIELTMNELEKQIDKVDEDVDAEMKGSGASGSRIALEKAIRKDKLEKEYNSQLKNYTTYANKANNLITQNTTVYQTQQQQQQAQNAAMLPFLTDQYKTQQEKLKAEQALNDPATQIKATMDEFAKLGIVAQGDLTSKIAEFKASGKTLPEYITGLRQQFMSKPEYKKIQELQAGQLSDVQKVAMAQNFDLKKMGLEQNFQMQLAQAKQTTNNKWTKLDDGMYTNESGDIVTADELKTAKLMNNSYISKPINSVGGECGVYASRSTGMTSTPGGNSKDARFKAFTDKTPQLGGMVFFGGEGYDKTYGHLAYVTEINDDGTMTVRDSNYKQNANGEGIIQERRVPITSATGFYNNTPLAKAISGDTGTQATPGQYTDQNINDLAYLTELQEKNPTQASKDMKDLGYTSRDIANYKAGNVPLTEKQKTSSINLANSIKDLLTNYDYIDATGFHFFDEAPSGSDWASAEEKIKTIVANLTLPSLGQLKGPMSDKDLAFIQAASSNLSTKQNDEAFGKQLLSAYNLAARRAGIPEVTSLDEIKKATLQPQVMQTNANTGTVNTGVGQTQEYKGYVIRGMN